MKCRETYRELATAKPCARIANVFVPASLILFAITLILGVDGRAYAQAGASRSLTANALQNMTDAQLEQLSKDQLILLLRDVRDGGDGATKVDLAAQGEAYRIDAFVLRVDNTHEDFPTASELLSTPLSLGWADGAYVGHNVRGAGDVSTSLSGLENGGSHLFYRGALTDIASQLTASLRSSNIADVSVTIDPSQINSSGQDQRNNDATLTLIINGSVPTFTITAIEPVYAPGHPDVVPVEELLAAPINLASVEGGYAAPRNGNGTKQSLGSLCASGSAVFFPSAIKAINTQLVNYFNERGMVGIFVMPNSDDLANARSTPTTLHLTIHIALVGEIRTLGAGKGTLLDERTNNTAHNRIRRLSPLVSASDAGEAPEGQRSGDVIRRDMLEDYIYRLNRHPGRRVDLAVSADTDPGYVVLDYLVSESKPWYVMFQVTNTGTDATDEMRERFSFVHNQLTDNDDILRLDYTTANFDTVHALSASYERPWYDSQRLRWKVFGSYNQYTSSDVGISPSSSEYEGEGWSVGGQLIANLYQNKNLFVDLYGGVRYEHTEVDNNTQALTSFHGEGDFVIPEVGLRLQRMGDYYATYARLGAEFQVNSDNDTSQTGELVQLGRQNPDETWEKLLWDVSHSFYLEPVFNKKAWRDASTPETSTLAHELAFNFRGQYGFDNRFVPTHEMTAGGFYTVRGYPESATAADTVMLATAEYRFHVPRLFPISRPTDVFGHPFRFAPDRVYGRPDWDLILRGFVDVGKTIKSDRAVNLEKDHTLVGAGFGVEFQVKQNLSLRADWGWVLHDAEFSSREHSEVGDNRIHAAATLLW